MLSRRLFLKSSGLAMFGVGAAPLWMARAAAGKGLRKKVLVAIFQRGAVDGLNVVIPFAEKNYYAMRPTIAIPPPKSGAIPSPKSGVQGAESAIDLNGFFGLHPALAPLKPMYDARKLAIVHAVGSPDPTRSHFDAQDYMESGTPGRKATPDGWLNRALGPDAGAAKSPVRAVSLGATLPRALRGHNDAVAIRNLDEFKVSQTESAATFESMYAGLLGNTTLGNTKLDQALHGTGRETFDAVKLIDAIQKQAYTPGGGAKYPGGRLGQSLLQIARLIKADAGLEVAFTDVGGWDTHVNEVGPTPGSGQLANLLGNFAQALAAFYQDLGDRLEDVVVVTMSEFGRTVRENGSRGTDHGHANVMFVFGGAVRGGEVYGAWPGLAGEQLYENRDLAVTTDFRAVLGEVVSKHLGNNQLGSIFPGWDGSKFAGIIPA